MLLLLENIIKEKVNIRKQLNFRKGISIKNYFVNGTKA